MGKGGPVICIKDTWTKPKGSRIDGERWGWLQVGVKGRKWIQLYLNNNKKKRSIIGRYKIDRGMSRTV